MRMKEAAHQKGQGSSRNAKETLLVRRRVLPKRCTVSTPYSSSRQPPSAPGLKPQQQTPPWALGSITIVQVPNKAEAPWTLNLQAVLSWCPHPSNICILPPASWNPSSVTQAGTPLKSMMYPNLSESWGGETAPAPKNTHLPLAH